MKPVSEWNEGDLRALVANEVQESLELDYKRSDALAKTDTKKNEISKDVSAFANSAGGRIIYGVIEEGHRPIDLDGGSDPSQITREWLEQVINSTIQQRIRGVRIKAIQLTAGGNAFVVDIPPSANGPHQANDKRYYKRFEFQSVAMHDYEVRDVAGRSVNPVLDLEWKMVRSGRLPDAMFETLFEISLINSSAAPALYSAITLYLDVELEPHWQSGSFSTDRITAPGYHGSASAASQFRRTLAVPDDHPAYRERPFSLGMVVVKSRPNTAFMVGYSIGCPGFSLTRQGAAFIDVSGRLRLEWFDE